jgi:adenine-specific DNA-methyltransferase
MNSSAASQVLALADSNSWQTCVEKTRAERGEDGQFFTPPVIARCLAGWFKPEGFNQPSLYLLDPGAGGGVLTAALVERILALRASGVLPALKEVTLEVWELDEAFLPALRQNLAACAEALRQAEIRTTLQVHHGSYIEGATRALDSGLFETSPAAVVSHAILNPPYRKIANRSRERALLATVGIETTNLYSAFVSLALRQLADGGELAAITPRSFCNGPYFREFRCELMGSANFHRVHVFDSRAEAFGRDQVLQENILFHLSRGKPGKAALTVSTGSLEAPVKTRVPRDQFVSPSDPDQVIHIATDSDASEVRSFFEGLPCHLPDLDIQVSTGPVVDFRLKEFLSDHLGPGSVPLIYPDVKALERLGKASLDDTRQTAIDLAMTEHLGAPSFPAS